jgi:hypothetical protein
LFFSVGGTFKSLPDDGACASDGATSGIQLLFTRTGICLKILSAHRHHQNFAASTTGILRGII